VVGDENPGRPPDRLFEPFILDFATLENVKKVLPRWLKSFLLERRPGKESGEKNVAEERIRDDSILTERRAFPETPVRVSIKAAVPRKREAPFWGDYHFACALKKYLERRGYAVRIDLLPDWHRRKGFRDEVVIVLRGLSRYAPRPDQVNLLWNISHPDHVPLDEYGLYDHVFVASLSYGRDLEKRLPVPVTPLLQGTDPELFYEEKAPGVAGDEILFVGNSRKQFRPAVRDALAAGVPLSLYGLMWEPLVPGKHIKGSFIENQVLRHHYSACKILLNDHWPSMKENGFISNRIFDAGACGACIVSDFVADIPRLFGDAVLTYRTPDELGDLVRTLLSDEAKRKSAGARLKEMIRRDHGFDTRAEVIHQVIRSLFEERSPRTRPFRQPG